MISFYGNIKDFWTESLNSYEFPNSVNTGQNPNFHENYYRDTNNLLQGFDEELPAVCQQFYKELNVESHDKAMSWTCLVPGNVIPVHQDKFYKLRTKHNVDISKCLRFLVFLQDWELGHYVEFEERVITQWKKGDVWMFNHESKHFAGNSSNNNFYTCQINIVEDKNAD